MSITQAPFPLEIILSSPESAATNMQKDVELLESLKEHPRCILRFYQWKHPSATYGYFIKPEEFFKKEGIASDGLDLARRPTGGGIIFHFCDLSFAFLMPASHPGFSLNTLENYNFVNVAVLEALKEYTHGKPQLLPMEEKKGLCCNFCMAQPTQYDVMLEGRKVAGGAQRRTKQGLLHQGTIALSLPGAHFLEKVLLDSSCTSDTMRANSYPLLPQDYTQEDFHKAEEALVMLMIHNFQKRVFTQASEPVYP